MIILASASPRRQELLSLICDSFKTLPADIDEMITEDVELEKNPNTLPLKRQNIFTTAIIMMILS